MRGILRGAEEISPASEDLPGAESPRRSVGHGVVLDEIAGREGELAGDFVNRREQAIAAVDGQGVDSNDCDDESNEHTAATDGRAFAILVRICPG